MPDASQTNQFHNFNAGAVTFGPHSTANNVEAPRTDPPPAAASNESTALIIVVTETERDAVLAAVRRTNSHVATRRNTPHHTVFELGTVARTNLRLAQIGPGTVTPDAAGSAAPALIESVRPDAVILAGVCYGLRPRQQRLGDVLVASELIMIAHHKVDSAGRTLIRGGHVHPSARLIDRFRASTVGTDHDFGVWFGPILTESVLIDNRRYRDRLVELAPEAIGGEMEGAGVYAAANRAKLDWCLVKAVCDWGDGKNDRYHAKAASNAATVMMDVLAAGGLNPIDDLKLRPHSASAR